jgi:hypothetical protein
VAGDFFLGDFFFFFFFFASQHWSPHGQPSPPKKHPPPKPLTFRPGPAAMCSAIRTAQSTQLGPHSTWYSLPASSTAAPDVTGFSHPKHGGLRRKFDCKIVSQGSSNTRKMGDCFKTFSISPADKQGTCKKQNKKNSADQQPKTHAAASPPTPEIAPVRSSRIMTRASPCARPPAAPARATETAAPCIGRPAASARRDSMWPALLVG